MFREGTGKLQTAGHGFAQHRGLVGLFRQRRQTLAMRENRRVAGFRRAFVQGVLVGRVLVGLGRQRKGLLLQVQIRQAVMQTRGCLVRRERTDELSIPAPGLRIVLRALVEQLFILIDRVVVLRQIF